MRVLSPSALCGFLAAASLSLSADSAISAAVPAAVFAFSADARAGSTAPIQAGDRWYARDYDDDDDDLDDDDYYPPAYYPPPPPVRVYHAPPPPPVVEYEPHVYGWYYAPPPRPANCGQYRYWNGDRCADARYDPPYVGPRW
jgi:hypothetical protein